MPLLRKLPKRGFSGAAVRRRWSTINVEDLASVDAHAILDEASLRRIGLIRGHGEGVKLLAGGSISRAVIVRVDAASAEAVLKVERVGGRVELVSDIEA